MKAISKILALALVATSASSATAQLVKHDDGVTFDDIKTCLTETIGLEENVHFRKKPGSNDTIQLNRARVQGDSFDLREVDKCWKKQTASTQDK